MLVRPPDGALRTVRKLDRHTSCVGGDTTRGRFRHPRENFVWSERFRHPLGEIGHDLVRRGTLSVNKPVREVLHALANGLEGDGHDSSRNDREQEVWFTLRPDQAADPNDDAHVDRRNERGQRAEDDGPVDDDVDVVEAVLQDGDTDRRWERYAEPADNQEVRDNIADDPALRARWNNQGRQREQHIEDDRDAERIDDPPDLLLRLALRAAQPEHQRDNPEQDQWDNAEERHPADGAVFESFEHRKAGRVVHRGHAWPLYGQRIDDPDDVIERRHGDHRPDQPPPPWRGQPAVGKEQHEQNDDPRIDQTIEQRLNPG